MRTLMTLLTLVFASTACAQDTFELPNGAKIVVVPVEDVDWVGVESFYDVGFVDEPEGLTQISHLAEHLMCVGDIGGEGPGVAWQRLASLGMANAETMGVLTHYDAMTPATSLDVALEVETGRLHGIGFDQALLVAEAGRCHTEARVVQSTPQAPMYKFAFMAAVQAWRYGATDVRVAGGLEDTTIDDMTAFLERSYGPSNLTLIVVGDVRTDDVKQALEQTIGTVPARHADALPAIDYTALPRLHEMTWDSSVPATIIGYAPPEDPAHQLVLSLFGAVLSRTMMTDPDLAAVSRLTLASSQTWPVGPLPMHAYSTLADGVDAAHAEETIGEWMESRAQLSAQDAMFVTGYVRQSMEFPPITAELVRAHAATLPRGGMITEENAVGMMLTNIALQIGFIDYLVDLYGKDAFEQVAAMSVDEMNEIIGASITPERRFVTRLSPADE